MFSIFTYHNEKTFSRCVCAGKEIYFSRNLASMQLQHNITKNMINISVDSFCIHTRIASDGISLCVDTAVS